MSGAQAIVTDEQDEPRAKSRKAPNAFRTISEVADELHIPQHVLRFWETKFPLVKPLKRGFGVFLALLSLQMTWRLLR